VTAVIDPMGEELRRQRDIAIAIWQQTRHTASTYLTAAQQSELSKKLLDKLGHLGDVAARF
jgi:hypothetical protein